MGVVLLSNSEDIRKKMLEMVSKCEKLQVILSDTMMKIEDSKGYFDTPTSLYFRDSADSYIIKQMRLIGNVLVPYIERLNKIADDLDEEFEDEKKILNVEGDNK